jgi:hypothetical protein
MEFKKAYNSQGIHIYDVNLQGNYGNGNQKGSISFKVRKNDDVQGFNEKLSDINSKIVTDFKVDVKNIKETNKRTM